MGVRFLSSVPHKLAGVVRINLNIKMGETMSVTPYTIFCAANSQFAIGVKDRIVNSPVILCDTKSNKEERYQWLIREDNTIALRVDPTLILDTAKLADYQTFYLSVYNSQKILDTQKWVYDGDKHFRNEGNPNFVIDNQGRATSNGNPIIVHAYNGSPAQEWNPKSDLKLKPTRFFYAANKRFAIGAKRAIANQPVVLLDTTNNVPRDLYEWIPQEDNTFVLSAGGQTLALTAASVAQQQSMYLSVYDSNNVTAGQQWIYDDNGYIRNVQDPTFVIDNKGSSQTDGNTIWVYKFNGSDAEQWVPTTDLSLEKST